MKKTLDFVKEGSLDPFYNRLFDEVATESIPRFNQWINEINHNFKGEASWMFSSPSSRNPYSSRLFYQFCCLELLMKIDLSEIDRILVYGKAMELEVNKILVEKNTTCHVINKHISISSKISVKLNNFINISDAIVKFILPFICSLFFKKKYNIKEPIILIDTFVGPGFVDKDRYYEGLIENISNAQDQCYFAPQYTGYSGLKGYWDLISETRKSKRNFILKEDFISLMMIVRIIFSTIRNKHNLKLIMHSNYVSLISEAMTNVDSIYSIFIAKSNYLFFQQMKEQRYECKTIINWAENQQIDKGWNKGANTYFPEAKKRGYKGALDCDLYLCFQPIESEVEYGYTPNEYFVLGKNSAEKSYYQELNLVSHLAPAFRYQSMIDKTSKTLHKTNDSIMLCLPIGETPASNILSLTIPILNEFNGKVFIKRHPVGPSQNWLIDNSKVQPNHNIEWVDGDFHSLLEQVSIFVGSSSSTCFDAVLMQKSVIIVSTSGFSYNYIPNDINASYYNWVYSSNEFKESLQSLIQNKPKLEKVNIDDYFSPVNTELCESLIS